MRRFSIGGAVDKTLGPLPLSRRAYSCLDKNLDVVSPVEAQNLERNGLGCLDAA